MGASVPLTGLLLVVELLVEGLWLLVVRVPGRPYEYGTSARPTYDAFSLAFRASSGLCHHPGVKRVPRNHHTHMNFRKLERVEREGVRQHFLSKKVLIC